MEQWPQQGQPVFTPTTSPVPVGPVDPMMGPIYTPQLAPGAPMPVVPGGPQPPVQTGVVTPPAGPGPNRARLFLPKPGAVAQGLAPQGGAPPAETPFAGPKYMTTGGAPAKYSKADIARERGLAGRMKEQAGGFLQAREEMNRDARGQAFAWLQEARAEQFGAGRLAEETRQEYTRAGQSVERARRMLDGMQIDPNRVWNQMTAGQRVMHKIGVAFGAIAQGLSGGRLKNAAVEAMDKAVQQDIGAQRQNMTNAINQLQVSARQRAHLFKVWDRQEERARLSGLQVMKIQASRMGLQEQNLGLREKWAGVVNGLDQHINDVLRQSRGRGGRRAETFAYKLHLQTQAQKELIGARGKEQLRVASARAGMRRGKEERGDRGVKLAIAQLPHLKKLFLRRAWASVGGVAFTEDAAEYDQKRALLGLSLWRLFDSGKLSDADRVEAYSRFVPNAKLAGVPGARSSYAKNFDKTRTWLMKGYATRAGTHMVRKASEDEKDAWAKMYGLSPEQRAEM
jgi:hypothetical protein